MKIRCPSVRPTSGRVSFKLVFGLVGLLVGAVLGLLVLSPSIVAKRGGSYAEKWFAENYQGRLALGELDLAWRDEQRLKDIRLFDPEGVEVGSADVTLPPLWDWVSSRGQDLGTIEIDVAAEIVSAADGTTNLTRALEPRGPVPQEETPELPALQVIVRVSRLVVSDATGARPPLILSDTRVDVSHAAQGPWIVRAAGGVGEAAVDGRFDLGLDLVPGPDDDPARPARVELHATGRDLIVAPHLTAVLGSSRPLPVEPVEFELSSLLSAESRDLHLDLTSASASFVADGKLLAAPIELPGLAPGDAWDVELKGRATGWAASLVDAIAEQDGLVTDVFGDTLDLGFDVHFTGTSLEDANAPIEVTFESPNASLSLAGRLEAGHFKAGADSGGLSVALALTPLVNERIVGPLMPMLVAPERPRGAKPMRISLRDFDLGLGEGIGGLAGQLSLDLGPADFSFLPKIVSELDLPLRLSIPEGTALGMRLDGGVVHYDALPIVIGGQRLPLGGSFDLTTRTFDLAGSVPASLWGSELEKRLGTAGARLVKDVSLPFTIGGSPTSPKIAIEPPDLGDALQDTLREGLEGELEKALGDNLPKLGDDLEKSLGGLLGTKKKEKKPEPPEDPPKKTGGGGR